MDLEAALIDELTRAHRVHTIILYGSRARGDATPASDLDVAGFADVERTSRDARLWRGLYLDGFVHPTERAVTPDAELLGFLHGHRVLLDERGLAAPLIDALGALERRGPTPLTDDDAQMRRVWARKMLPRIGRGDVEAHYRQHWLLSSLLEDHFALRGVWYRGPKLAFAELAAREPALFDAFARALAPGAPLAAVEALVERVVGPTAA